MRVAHFAGTMRPGHDGVTRVLYRMTTALAGAGVDHVFVAPFVPPETERTATMIEVPSVAFPLYTDYRLATPGSRFFGKQVLDFRPDILHIHSPCSLGYAAVRFGKKHNIPVVATYHTHFASYAKYYNIPMLEPFGWSYLRHLYDGCDRIFVPSMPILDELWTQGFRRLHHLPHGVDATMFNPGHRSFSWRTAHGIPGNKKMLLFAGRLVWEKDLRTLAAAYELVSTQRQDIVFALAGDGPIRQELQGLMPNAVFLGQLDGTDLSRAYASADLFVFPSTTETFGNVIIESMASGTVPVCAREGGAAGVVLHGVTGLLTTPRDPADLGRAITELLDAPARRESMALQGLEFARRQSWQNIFQTMIDAYREVIHERTIRRTQRPRKAA
ncbi:phosphatidylinositol alpha 1,6-mannosyltransferase [Anaerolineae bacterium]|nr:phosphatidylinositol alpha 1,6-mannosyltransferase [Anaerolineae bacterium]